MDLSSLRRFTQLASTVFTNSYFASFATRAVNTNSLKGICVPVLNCYSCPSALFSCPIGTLQHFSAMHAIPYYALGLIGAVGAVVGRMPCGWICPFGFVQDLMYKIRSRKYRIPQIYTYVKYLVLLLLVFIIPFKTGEPWFSKLCPAGTLSAHIPWLVWNPVNPATGLPVMADAGGLEFYISVLILAIFLFWFVLSKRPFCRVACPMGALLSFFNCFSMVRLEVVPACDGCATCETNCPMDLNVYEEIGSKDCILCLECTRCGHVRLITPFALPEEVR